MSPTRGHGMRRSLTPRKRTPNWSTEELNALTSAMRQKRSIIFSKGATTASMDERRDAWKWITAAVNAVGGHPRTTQQVKEKWQNHVYSKNRLRPKSIENDGTTAISATATISNQLAAISNERVGFQPPGTGPSRSMSPAIASEALTPRIENDVDTGDGSVNAIAHHNDSDIGNDQSFVPDQSVDNQQLASVDFALLEHQRRMELLEREHEARMELLSHEAKMLDAKLELVKMKMRLVQEKMQQAAGMRAIRQAL